MARRIITKLLGGKKDIVFDELLLKKIKFTLKQKAFYSVNEFFDDCEFAI